MFTIEKLKRANEIQNELKEIVEKIGRINCYTDRICLNSGNAPADESDTIEIRGDDAGKVITNIIEYYLKSKIKELEQEFEEL